MESRSRMINPNAAGAFAGRGDGAWPVQRDVPAVVAKHKVVLH
ncbi:hypothetical protein VFA_002652 [Vibrio furnissii CIP 102972]|nr:hypothetical protein VFA_002652 [Vibrio furnissii CIP 102972]